jgi:hypothetical protein
MTLAQLLAQREAQLAAARSAREAAEALRRSILSEVTGDDLTDEQQARFDAASAEVRTQTDTEARLDAEVTQLRADAEADARRQAEAEQRQPGAAAPQHRATVTSEARTYGQAGISRREAATHMRNFLRDVARSAHFNDFDAQQRLSRHQAEERTERAAWFAEAERAAGSSAFSGLVVPQYLVDLVAPHAKNARPLADAMNGHVLPADGLVLNISKITTGTTTALQASEGSAVNDSDVDDTLLAVNVQTNAGQSTLSRQAVERGVGTDDILMEDLVLAYHSTLDATLITQATTGLSAAAGATVAYTDASPTAAELYPKVLDAASRVEAALLTRGGPADIAVMHSRRWYWLQSQLSSTWPLFGQPGIAPQMGGVNLAEEYGAGVRGVLPNGAVAIVDNNIATNLGAGTNEDEIYVANSRECHLWEDPDAPLFIRTEEVKAATLQVLFVLYGYFGYTFTRYTGATAKIGGTGLVTPTF